MADGEPEITPDAEEKLRPAGSEPVIWKSWKPAAVGTSSTSASPTKNSNDAAP